MKGSRRGGRGGQGSQDADAARPMPGLIRGGMTKQVVRRANAAKAARHPVLEPLVEARKRRLVGKDFTGDGGMGGAAEDSAPTTVVDPDADPSFYEDEDFDPSPVLESNDADEHPEHPHSKLQRLPSDFKTPSSTSTRLRPSSHLHHGSLSAADRLRKQDDSASMKLRLLEAENENYRLKNENIRLQVRTHSVTRTSFGGLYICLACVRGTYALDEIACIVTCDKCAT